MSTMDYLEFIAISDVHGRYSYVKRLGKVVSSIELLIIAGDITRFGRMDDVLDFINNALEYFNTILFVPSNYNPHRVLGIDSAGKKTYNVHGRLYRYGQYHFYGIGGSNKTPFNTYIEFSDNYLKDLVFKVDRL